MKLRTFTVPFAEIVGSEATELEFGPGDYLVVRSIFSMPTSSIRDLQAKLGAVTEDTSAEEVDVLILDVLGRCVVEWHLDGPDGTIPLPKTAGELNELPGSIRGALFSFLTSYRGPVDPTPAA